MAKVIDITSKLTNDKPKLKIRDKEFEINHEKNAVFEMNKIIDEAKSVEDETVMGSVTKLMLGEKAAKEIDALKLSFADHRRIFIAIIAGATDEEYEELERRFLGPEQA